MSFVSRYMSPNWPFSESPNPQFKTLIEVCIVFHKNSQPQLKSLTPVLFQSVKPLKWYYDKKNHFFFSSDFETLFTKHTPCGNFRP